MIVTDYSPPPANEVKKVNSGEDNALMSMGDIGSFIKLFVAQMNNQDPLNPADSTDIFNQTSQITMVEQLVTMNKKSDTTKNQLDSLDKSLSSAYLGRTVNAVIEDEDGKPMEVTGVVLGISYEDDGSVLLGLETGDAVKLADVTSVFITTAN